MKNGRIEKCGDVKMWKCEDVEKWVLGDVSCCLVLK